MRIYLVCEIRDLKFKVRALSSKEIEELSADGIDFVGLLKIKDREERFGKIDKIFRMIAPGLKSEDLTPAETGELFKNIARLTILSLIAVPKIKNVMILNSYTVLKNAFPKP